MAEIITQHTDCHICGKSMPIGETLCSEDCNQKFQKIVKRRKIILYLLYGMLAALIAIIVVGPRLV